MSNPMHPWNEPPKTSPLSPEQGTRLFFGAVLVVFGLIVGGALVYQLKQIVLGTSEPALVARLTPASADDVAIVVNHSAQGSQPAQSSRIQLPPKTLNVI